MPLDATYVRALRFPWLTRFYDRLIQATLKEEAFKRRLIEQADLRPGQRVLDVGCGTGTLTVMLQQSEPSAEVVGLDGDSETLAIARDKATAAGVSIVFHEAMAYAPPFAAGSFDRIVSSLLFHHLTTEVKRRTLAKIFDLLRPGGTLHIADWGAAQDRLMRVAFLGVQVLDGFATTADNVAGKLPAFMRQAGFTGVREMHRERTVFGTLSLYAATKPQ